MFKPVALVVLVVGASPGAQVTVRDHGKVIPIYAPAKGNRDCTWKQIPNPSVIPVSGKFSFCAVKGTYDLVFVPKKR